MVIITILILVSSAFSLIPSLLTGRIIDEGLIGGDFDRLVKLIGLSFLVLIGSNLIDLINSYLNSWVSQHISLDMKLELYSHLQRMSQSFFATSKQGELLTRMTSDISGVQRTISGTLVSILQKSSLLVLALMAMFRKSWILASLGLIPVPLFVLPTKKVGKKRWEMTGLVQEKNDQINQVLNESLSVSGQKLAKLFNKQEERTTRPIIG